MKAMVQAETAVESVLQWERDWFRRASMGELTRREGREATTAGASRLYMNEREFKTKLRDLAANAVRQSIKLRLSDSTVLDIGRTVAARVRAPSLGRSEYSWTSKSRECSPSANPVRTQCVQASAAKNERTMSTN